MSDRVKIVVVWMIPWFVVAVLTASAVLWGQDGFWIVFWTFTITGLATFITKMLMDINGWEWDR